MIPKLWLPAVVLEIVLGIATGPSGLRWVKSDLHVQFLALVGLAFLLFLADLLPVILFPFLALMLLGGSGAKRNEHK